MNITGKEIMIFAKEFDGKMRYRAGLSRKKQDGSYDKAYIDVKLPKDAQVENKTKINITKGFLSFYNYTGKEGKSKTIWYVVVQEYTLADAIKEQEVYKVETISDDQLGLPF